MMFSEKFGYKLAKEMQYESASDSLRVRIWNLFYLSEIQAGGLSSARLSQALNGEPTAEILIADKLGINISPNKQKIILEQLEHFLINDSHWYEVYDFIEMHLSSIPEEKRPERIKQYNQLLEEEKSGYRVIAGEVVPISNPAEIQAIENAINSEFNSVSVHMKKALSLYADFKNPDYENSIKESISAVEAMCCIITEISGGQATLGKAIKKLKDSGVHIHSAMESAFSSLYGYTSDENGIRHGGIDFTNAPAEDAKFMLVSCSAFVNYLIEKQSKILTTKLQVADCL